MLTIRSTNFPDATTDVISPALAVITDNSEIVDCCFGSGIEIDGAVTTCVAAIKLEGVDSAESPFIFVALTVNLYPVLANKPVTLNVPPPACESVCEIPVGIEVKVYEVITSPPSSSGAANETVAVVPLV
jgi:hypothetical protein